MESESNFIKDSAKSDKFLENSMPSQKTQSQIEIGCQIKFRIDQVKRISDLQTQHIAIQRKVKLQRKMEEKSIIYNNQFQISLSDWKLRHNLYQTTRNYRQLENRINILELQKKKKLKDIENKLTTHKKLVQNKIYKHQLKTTIQAWTNSQAQKQNSNSRMFQVIKESRRQNIKKKQQEMLETKHKMFSQIKSLRRQNEQIISIKKLQNLEQKISKRNRVRLIEIGCKENIQGFWNSRLQSFQEEKKLQISRKLREQQRSLKKLQRLEKNEESLLEEIKRAEYIENDLKALIKQEKSMDGSQLNNLYVSKVVNTLSD